MSSGFQTATITTHTDAGHTTPIGTAALVLATPEIQAKLAGRGYNPADFNTVAWPIGISRPAHGTLLIDRAGLETIQGETGPKNALLTIGSDGATITVPVETMPPYPLLIGLSTGLYALPITDARNNLARTRSDANYNAIDHDGRRFVENTAPATDTPHTYDEITALLAATLGITITITNASTKHPVDVRATGRPIVEILDELAAESGRVIVRHPDTGAYRLEHANTTTCLTALAGQEDRIMHGGIRWALSSTPAGLLEDFTPNLLWTHEDAPATISVGFPTTNSGSPRALNDHAFTTPTNKASTYSISANTGRTLDLIDRLYTPDNTVSAEAATRAEDIAQAFYRRYLAGAMDAELAGIHALPMGGGCQRLEWNLDAAGFTTVATADHNWSGYGWSGITHEDRFAAGNNIRITRGPRGEPTIHALPEILPAEVEGATPSTGQPAYDILVDGLGAYTGLQPKYRPGGSVDHTAAPIGARAWVRPLMTFNETQMDVELIFVEGEAIDWDTCVTPTAELENEAVIGATEPMIDNTGEILTSSGIGTVLLFSTLGTPEYRLLWDGILVGKDGDILCGKDGAAMIPKDADADAEGLWEAVLFDSTGDVLIGKDGTILEAKADLPS